MKNIVIIGTSHIAKDSAKRIIKTFKEFNPDVVCVELDFHRLEALLHPNKTEKPKIRELVLKVGIKGTFFYLIGRFAQKKIGDILKIQPGIDMLTAVKLARKDKKALFLIDRDIKLTLKKISTNLKLRELFSFFIKGLFLGKKKIGFDIRKTPKEEIVEKILLLFKKEIPSLYQILVEERNRIMAENILKIYNMNPSLKIMVVVGAGHKKGIEELLKHYSPPPPR